MRKVDNGEQKKSGVKSKRQAGAELGQAQLSYTLASQSSLFDQVNSNKHEQIELKNHGHQINLNTYILSN